MQQPNQSAAVSQDPATQGAQPGASPDAANQPGTPLVVIEVTVAQDGSITVEQESGAQESQEGAGQSAEGSGDGSQPVPVRNASEAASLVKQMLDAATQTTDQQTVQNKSEQSAGYQGQ